MSKALDYLSKVRPEVMADYFSFLKGSGKHLDDRTRAIISVITKVDKQTERGFRQYLKRALSIGVSANEIIDALFVAFPTLGLSKIVWAVDILLDMDLPEFAPEQLTQAGSWHHLCDRDTLADNKSRYMEVAGQGVYVSIKDGNIRVYQARCPHQGTALKADDMEGMQIQCPRHQWQFDLLTGNCISGGDEGLSELEYREENNQLHVQL